MLAISVAWHTIQLNNFNNELLIDITGRFYELDLSAVE